MKTAVLTSAILILAGVVAMVHGADDKGQDKAATRKLRHVVLFKFKAGTTDAQLKDIVDTFAGLPAKIDTIKGFEWGTDVSVENKSEGFTHCFFVTFDSEKGREIYLPHPAHQNFVKVVGPHVEKVLVVDYWAKV